MQATVFLVQNNYISYKRSLMRIIGDLFLWVYTNIINKAQRNNAADSDNHENNSVLHKYKKDVRVCGRTKSNIV